ncbi:MAG TPA: hypothetical protein PLK06_03795 [bacterium]|nr:hypothetical protein [bacterium]
MIAEHSQQRPEMTAYDAALSGMLPKHDGQYVVIKGDQLKRFFAKYDEALAWAYQQFGLEPFFVKRVTAEAKIVHYTRDLGPDDQ